MTILKSTLIGKSGKLIASKPKTSNIKHQLLESGLISAILEFSKSIHEQEIQSINYHDRTTAFIELDDFVLVVEIDADTSDSQKDKLLNRLQRNAKELLHKRTEDGLSIGEGELILEEVINSFGKKASKLSTGTLLDFTVGDFQIKHLKTKYEILSQNNCDDCINEIAAAIDRGLKLIDFKVPEFFSVLIPNYLKKCSYYFIIYNKKSTSKIYTMKVPYSETSNLFKVTPILTKELKKKFPVDKEFNISNFPNEIINFYSQNKREQEFDPEFFSINFLEKNIKNLDKAMYDLIIGNPVIVIGDRPSTKIAINTLTIFTQHLKPEIIEWFTVEENLALNITGMSEETYQKLIEQEIIDDTITTINLDDKKVRSKTSSVYIKKIYDKIKKKSPVIAYAFIGNELKKIESIAIKLTELILLDKGRALLRLKDIIEEVNNNHKMNKIIDLANNRIPWLKRYLDYLKSEQNTGKNYINIF